MKICVVENHHEVLLPWALDRIGKKYPAPVVLTLDHHTDTLPAFRDPEVPVLKNSWCEPEQVRAAISKLHHDEHFDWAVRAGLIERCVISSHVHAFPSSIPELEVRCDSRWQDENHVFADPEHYRPLADMVLENEYLESIFGPVLPENFILDIDCDYFSTARSFHPAEDSCFRKMVQQARMITVSLERDWVRLLRFPGENFTVEEIVDSLFQLKITK